MHPVEQVLRPPDALVGGAPRDQRIPRGPDLVQELLEPQLVDLVDRDEQQLVVRGRVGLEVLGVQELGKAQVAALGQLGSLLSERNERLSHGLHRSRP
jgi:hypothetical protein